MTGVGLLGFLLMGLVSTPYGYPCPISTTPALSIRLIYWRLHSGSRTTHRSSRGGYLTTPVFATRRPRSRTLLHQQIQTMIRPAQAVTTKVTTRTRRTSNRRVRNPGQVRLATGKMTMTGKDIEVGRERRTLVRRRWHHLVRSDGEIGRIHLGRRKTGITCHLHRHLHRAKREITPPNTYPLRDGKGLQVHRVTRVGRAKAVTGMIRGEEN